MIKENSSFEDGKKRCQVLAGEDFTPVNEKLYQLQLDLLMSTHQALDNTCEVGVYLGIQSSPSNAFVSPVEVKNEWDDFEPNAGELQQCIVLDLYTGKWSVKSCMKEHCSLCKFDEMITFSTRGLCELEEDWTFFITFDKPYHE